MDVSRIKREANELIHARFLELHDGLQAAAKHAGEAREQSQRLREVSARLQQRAAERGRP
jgi:hypothetical protein